MLGAPAGRSFGWVPATGKSAGAGVNTTLIENAQTHKATVRKIRIIRDILPP
jgi:hypothetical protein